MQADEKKKLHDAFTAELRDLFRKHLGPHPTADHFTTVLSALKTTSDCTTACQTKWAGNLTKLNCCLSHCPNCNTDCSNGSC